MDLFSFDDDYVRRLRAGDRETAEHFYAYFRDLLHAKLRRKLRSHFAIEELRQEVLVRVLARLNEIQDGRKLGAFVNTTCNYVLLEYYREPVAVMAPEHTDVPDPAPGPFHRLQSNRIGVSVRKVIGTLDPRDAAILTAVFLEEKDREEICREFGVDAQYLRVLLHRAREKFRKAYETFGR